MSDPMSEARLAEIEARASKATPGPWRRWVGKLSQAVSVMQGTGRDEVVHWTGFDNSHLSRNRRANGAFIAEARQDVPELLAEVRRPQTELGAAKERVGKTFDAVLVQANGIIRDKNEMDKVYLQADHIAGLIRITRKALGWDGLDAPREVAL